jgi:hypothetical protein
VDAVDIDEADIDDGAAAHGLPGLRDPGTALHATGLNTAAKTTQFPEHLAGRRSVLEPLTARPRSEI